MSTVPLPCPFCGSCSIGAYDGSTFRWLAARCNECGATAGEVRINTLIPRDEAWPQANEDALQEWNRRAQPQPEPVQKVLLHLDSLFRSGKVCGTTMAASVELANAAIQVREALEHRTP